ncbi:MarR family transcriptional regulator [Variovorax dokdonensis]|uniref:MarR family transcriptional regulator n=1 Tax=Variovorax dokdonensis TaxID=344883 RepID=A0ABT7N8Z0_9BURK|nr:MarR family transcriptional regulator [Variovorax dokdonensis]MDM0044414.1 MarR family transcriptional regulator [Variovorax dokdonensis]
MSQRTPATKGRYDLENSIGYLLNRAAALIAARFDDDLKQGGVSLQAWRILAALSQSEPQSLSELANHTGSELSYLSRSVVQLEKQGLVERSQSMLDKRASQLVRTPTGRALVDELAPKARHVERLSLKDISAEDLHVTLRTLREVCHNLIPHPDAPSAVNRKLTIARRVKQNALAQGEEPTPRRRSATKN